VALVNTTWSIVLAILGLLAATASAIAAFGAWTAARRSNEAATTLADIERKRWHTELTPRFDVTCYRSKSGTAMLRLTLTGPTGLDHLDQVAVAIRDDQTNRAPVTAGDPTAEDLVTAIWGPLRFRPHVDGADKLGRSIPDFPLARQETKPLAMELSLVPRWVSDADYWRRQYADHPLRLTITCIREGHKPWAIRMDVAIEPDPNDQASTATNGA
jgi:hypothetical protein